MQEEHAENPNVTTASEAAQETKREISTISFPYGDLDDAIDIAKAVNAVGGQSCQWEQLAGYLKVAATGGAFRARLGHARIYGLLEYGQGKITLTHLGLMASDSSQEEAARVDAFLAVPLYKAVYDKYKGYTLPPPAALEREMGNLGVSSKQTDKARQVFERAARQSGFFWAGTDRLTLPVVKGKPQTMPLEDPGRDKFGGGAGGDGGGRDGLGLDPLLIALLKKIPPKEDGWPASQRVRWFRTFAMNVSQVYDDDDSAVDLEIKVETDGNPK